MYVSKETVESVEQRMRVPRDVVLQDDALAIAAKVFAGHTGSALSRTRSLCVYSLRKDFTLDQGIPYPHRFVPNMLVADRFPVMRADPEKPVRTLAFAGWVTVTLQDLGEISAIQKQLRRAAERRDVL
jgi:hypothetical protein